MTTTDPTPLAEQIAREHLALLNTSTWLIVGCTCDRALTAPANGVAGSWYAAHIATVTERAVRERVAAEIEARGHEPFCLAFPPGDEPCPCGLDDAARIARGETEH